MEIPHSWRQNYLIKRIGEADIEISKEVRDAMLASLANGDRFVQVGEYTLMLNSIKSIDPLHEPNNIPPRPQRESQYAGVADNGQTQYTITKSSIRNQELWDKLFGDRKLLEEHV